MSIRETTAGVSRLGIPNQTVKRLTYGHLRDAWRDMGVFSADLQHFVLLTLDMARKGAWRPAVEYLAGQVERHTGIRDYLAGEKAVQTLFAAHFGFSDMHLVLTERELTKGYADLVLAPMTSQYPGNRYGYVLEFKVLKRRRKLAESAVARALTAAETQLRQYLAEPVATARTVGALSRGGAGVPRVGAGGGRSGGGAGFRLT